MHNKTFRLFISSTFSDFALEREVMQTAIFPKIEAFCASNGFQFQAIDLRWGVNEEAQLDQKTIEICINEVTTCKHFPHPNFLIMVGNRYGWVPLPYAIEKIEFENILHFYSDNHPANLLLHDWYQHDQNHLIPGDSTAYVIKPREGNFSEYVHWVKVEDQLREILQNAVKNLDTISEKGKYFKSATENEVIEGIYPFCKQAGISNEPEKRSEADYILDMEYVYGFIREIKQDKEDSFQSIFFDSEVERLDLFKTNIRKTLKGTNLLELKTGIISTEKVDEHYLKFFKEKFLEYLKASVTKQVKRISQSSTKEKTKTEHFAFKQERLKVFVGREQTLGSIHNYIIGSSNAPLVIFGKSGMGKTSLMAKAIDNESNNDTLKLIYRFIGASEKSTKIRTLLISIIREIDTVTAEELEGIFNDDIFNDRISRLFSETSEKTVIFIDAIDQLLEKSALKWLPEKLPPDLKLIISVLDDVDYKNDSGYRDLLKVKYSDESHSENFIRLKPLVKEDGAEILSKLLQMIHRTVTIEQRDYILNKFEESGYSPLYLVIAFQEIKNWKSFSSNFKIRLEDNIIDLIQVFIENLSNLYHHHTLLVNSTLGYLECSKNGLSEKEILDILSADREVMDQIENQFHQNLSGRIPVAPWARLYSQLSPFLIQKMSDNVSLITLFHRQFTNAIQNNILNTDSSRKKLHANLAAYFTNQPLVTSENIYNLRKLSEQAFQLYHSDQPDALLDLFEQDYINIKYELRRFYECLLEIEQAFMLIDDVKEGDHESKNRLFALLLKFFNSYSLSESKTFDFEQIHAYFIYRKRSTFYQEFLRKVSNKNYLKKFFSEKSLMEEYYLIFLSRQVNFLRRYAKLQEAAAFANEIISEYNNRLETEKDKIAICRQLSASYYELGYIFYLGGNFENANDTFMQSVDFAQKGENVIGEWITRCVMSRIAFIGGLASVDVFNKALDEAYEVFSQLESTNDVAKRWIMVIQHHKFEIAYHMGDLKMITKYYNYLRTNEWIKDYDIGLDLYEAQLKFVAKDYKESIRSFERYLSRFSREELNREEAIAEVLHDLGLAYYLINDQEKTKQTWEKALELDDKPGNHTYKRRITDKMKKYFGSF